MSNPERHTGLNSYILRTIAGQFVSDPKKKTLTTDGSAAWLWLWEPERVDERLVEVQREMWWAGLVTAVRAR